MTKKHYITMILDDIGDQWVLAEGLRSMMGNSFHDEDDLFIMFKDLLSNLDDKKLLSDIKISVDKVNNIKNNQKLLVKSNIEELNDMEKQLNELFSLKL